MPPRIPTPTCRSITATRHFPPKRASRLGEASAAAAAATFSTSSTCHKTQSRWLDIPIARRRFYVWLKTSGQLLRDPPTKVGSPKYAPSLLVNPNHPPPREPRSKWPTAEPQEGDGMDMERLRAWENLDRRKGYYDEQRQQYMYRPFQENREFYSQPVLSDQAQERIFSLWSEGFSLKLISAKHNVDPRRVAAVVRLMTIQNYWARTGKPLALPYARAMMKMLPLTNLDGKAREPPHESISDVGTLSATMTQLFVPTSESREFTRRDAAAAYGVLPADARVPVPEIVDYERDLATGMSLRKAGKNFRLRARRSKRAYAAVLKQKDAAARQEMTYVETPRFNIRIRNYSADDSPGPKGVGWRYGFPRPDRKRGQVKFPTRVGT